MDAAAGGPHVRVANHQVDQLGDGLWNMVIFLQSEGFCLLGFDDFFFVLKLKFFREYWGVDVIIPKKMSLYNNQLGSCVLIRT